MENSLSLLRRQLARRRGDYGFDAPYVPLLLGLSGVIFLAVGLLGLWVFTIPVLGVICLVYAIFFLLCAASYMYTTRWGKFRAWANILAELSLRGDEQLLDLGCGRGAVLLMAARLLPRGKAMGVDLWKSSDQSGNARSVTQRNAELEGVAERYPALQLALRDEPIVYRFAPGKNALGRSCAKLRKSMGLTQ